MVHFLLVFGFSQTCSLLELFAQLHAYNHMNQEFSKVGKGTQTIK
jgi:hypothetical protein